MKVEYENKTSEIKIFNDKGLLIKVVRGDYNYFVSVCCKVLKG